MRSMCLAVLLSLLASVVQATESTNRIRKLKDLHIDTVLVARGRPAAAIVASAGKRYAAQVQSIQNAVRACSGRVLPVVHDARDPEDLLKTTNVVALGNMATNPFIEHMYRQWYVLLDLKYPGKGGLVVRSCHNPYATGHNVIWIGGSDDDGVARAAKVFAGLLKESNPLKVGWLMQIQLGEGLNPPKPRDDGEGWSSTVYGWRDSWRKVGGQKLGYGPAGTFGWNPISVAGALYYMTGDPKHLAYFKRMAMPDRKNLPRANNGFKDPMDPLVKNSHYQTHLVNLVWELIEESPLFTDAERLFITNKLLAQQDHYDPDDTYKGWTRHGQWHMVCIYTGSRYFAKYYPNPRWQKRMGNARERYRQVFGNAAAGSDTLYFISTYAEPTFDFFMLDGFDDFVASGAARTLMSGLETIWTGKPNGTSTKYIPISLMHKAAYMLKDGRYIWLLRKLCFDLDVFRIGQSFWPLPDLKIEPPADLVGRISVLPLPPGDWHRSGKSIEQAEGFRFLSYRAGLGEDDDFFMLDGYYGHGRHPYHVNTLHDLRMSGQTLLRGFGNQLSVRCNGIVEEDAAEAAALKKAVALNGAAYVRTHVPNMPFSKWDRHILYVAGAYTFVLDEITARASGTFDVSSGWHLRGTPAPALRKERRVSTKQGATLCCAQDVHMGSRGFQAWSGDLEEGEAFALSTLIHAAGKDHKGVLSIDPLGRRANLVRGPHRAFVAVGPFRSEALTVDARIANVSSSNIFLADATRLVCDGYTVLQSERPVSVVWSLGGGRVAAQAEEGCRLTLAADTRRTLHVKAGRSELGSVVPARDLRSRIAHALESMQDRIAPTPAQKGDRQEADVDWQPRWKAEIKGSVTDVGLSLHSKPKRVWAITKDRKPDPNSGKKKECGRLALLSTDGKIVGVHEYETRALSLWAAADKTQAAAFSALVVVGSGDETLRAYSANGRELWQRKTEVDPSWRIGDRYNGPWFTDPRRVSGASAVRAGDFWDAGKQEIVLGLPSTVEFRDFSGTLLKRLPVKWGMITTLTPLTKRGKQRDKPRPAWLLTGSFSGGGTGLSAIDRTHRRVNSSGYYCAAAVKMGAWLQRGISHIVVSDLDNNGIEEVVVGLSGHWNEIDVYSSEVKGWKKWLWRRFFGPGWRMSRTLRAVLALDVTGDGNKEVIAGIENGWLCVFDHRGEPVWQKKFPRSVLSVCACGEPGTLAVGCGDGMLCLLGRNGKTLRTARLKGGIEVVRAENHTVVAGTHAGEVALFPVPGGRR